MIDAEIPQEIKDALRDEKYRRPDKAIVGEVLRRLGVPSQSLVHVFFESYEGPFWSEYLGYELLDVLEGEETLETATATCRKTFAFPESSLVLTQLSSGQVVVLNTERDKVYEVDFEGGDRLLVSDGLSPRWDSFRDFLLEYFVAR